MYPDFYPCNLFCHVRMLSDCADGIVIHRDPVLLDTAVPQAECQS